MKAKHQRLFYVLGSLAIMGLATALMLRGLYSSLIFFYTPSQLKVAQSQNSFKTKRPFRLGGLVKPGSIVNLRPQGLHFVITDLTSDVPVRYEGLLPSLFRENQGVVAQGTLENGTLHATQILAKHDETYLPPNVVAALKASGRWKGPQ